MSGYAFVLSPCICCGKLFSYNPHRVPSTPLLTGTREPICRPCVTGMNEARAKKGLPLFEVLPGAYEPLPEDEL